MRGIRAESQTCSFYSLHQVLERAHGYQKTDWSSRCNDRGGKAPVDAASRMLGKGLGHTRACPKFDDADIQMGQDGEEAAIQR